MGNCSFKGIAGNIIDSIRIMTDSGGIIEYRGPVHVGNVMKDFPGCGVYRKGHLSSPLFHHEQLFSSCLYYLLPLEKERVQLMKVVPANDVHDQVIKGLDNVEELGMINNNQFMTPLRVSTASRTSKEPALEVLPSMGNGVWRVKLVIDTKQLEEILKEQVDIGDLIEKMRMVASSSVTPRRSKLSWRPSFSGVFKVSPAADSCKEIANHGSQLMKLP